MTQPVSFPSGPKADGPSPLQWCKHTVGVGAIFMIGGSSHLPLNLINVPINGGLLPETIVSIAAIRDIPAPSVNNAPVDDSENGPFRDGMKTAFPNVPKLTKNMAGLMNVHYQTLCAEGFNKHAALAFTLHMVKETTGGLSLSEQKEGGPGDGAGSVQFSHWDGDGTGRELTWFQNPDTKKPWDPKDVMATEEGGRVSRRQAVVNSAKAIAVLVRNMPNYQELEQATSNPDESFAALAMKSTKNFVRQSEPNDVRAGWIIDTYKMNQKSIERNIGLMTSPEPSPPINIVKKMSP